MDIFFFWGGEKKKWILLFICFCCLKAQPWTSRLPSFNLEMKSTWIAEMGGLDIPPESLKADRHIVHADEEPLRGTRQLLQHGPNCDINKKGAGEERRSQRGCCNGGGFIATGQHFLIKRRAKTCTNGFSLTEPDWLGLTGCASVCHASGKYSIRCVCVDAF